MSSVEIDVHSASCLWYLLDEQGKSVATGKTQTSFTALCELGAELKKVS